MQEQLVEKKILLLKSIWSYSLVEKVSISLPMLPKNVRIIVQEIIELVEELDTIESKKQMHDILRLRKRIFYKVGDLRLYLYFVEGYWESFNAVLKEIDPLNRSGENIKTLALSKAIGSLYEEISSRSHLNPILNRIEKILLSPTDIDDSMITQLASLVTDSQSELLWEGYHEDGITKFLDEFEFNHKEGFDKRPLFQQFNLYKESLTVEEKRFEYIFRIRGLKVYAMPFIVDDIHFYNPLRHDLIEWKMKLPIYEEEEFLLEYGSKEVEIFQSQDYSKYDEVAYTDCHARVKINAKNPKYGAHLASKRLQQTVDKIRHVYKLKNIEICSSCVYIDLENNAVIAHPLYTYSVPNKYDISYWAQGLNDTIIRDLKDEDSLMNQAGRIDSEPWRNKTTKARQWYIRGLDSGDTQTEYLCYWISLEYLLKSKPNQSMYSLLTGYALPLLILLAYENELGALIDYFARKLSRDVPAEIKDIPDIGDFPRQVKKATFAKNLLLFAKYSDDDLIKYRIRFLHECCFNIYSQKNSIQDLQKRYRFLLSELTRIRNTMVHDTASVEFNLSFYCSYLKYISSILISNCIYQFQEDFTLESLNVGFEEWQEQIKRGKKIEFFR